MDDEQPVSGLVARAREGDQAAWDSLVERYTPLVLSVVRRHRLSGSDADDVVQTLWLRLVEHLDGLREPEALPGWIAVTARHECLRLLRSGRRTQPVDPQITAVLEAPQTTSVEDEVLEDLVLAQRREALLAAFATLPDHQRRLLALLVEVPPLSYGQISERLSIPVGAIGPTRARALRRIRTAPAVASLLPAAGEERGVAEAATAPRPRSGPSR